MNQQTSNIKKMAVVAIPTMHNSDWNYLQNLRQTYDPKGHAFIVPHFTIFSTTKPSSKQKFGETLRDNLFQQKRIDFSLRTAIFMPPLNGHKSWYAFLIPTEGFNEFISLHRTVYSAVLPHTSEESYFFIPHLTIGSFQYKADCLKLVNEINASEFELSGYVDKLSVIEDHNNSACVVE